MDHRKLFDESGRMAALKRYEILDTPREAAFEKITALVQAALRVPISAVSLVDSGRQWFKSMHGLDVSETGRDVSFCDHAIRLHTPLVIPDARSDIRFADNALVTGDPLIRAYAGVPLQTPDGYNVGALCAIDTVPRTFEPMHLDMLHNLAGLVVDELELRQIACADSLTGLLTRRAFLLDAERRMAAWRRHGDQAALLILDIDHFKKINDTYGHAAGDEVLRRIADCCKRTAPEASIGRLGGEEFAVLLADCDSDRAQAVAERLRLAIAALAYEGLPDVRMTTSIGIAVARAGCRAAEAWLHEADGALYRAKTSGRNRWCLAHPAGADRWVLHPSPISAHAGATVDLRRLAA